MNPLKILIVEDNKPTSRIMKHVLQEDIFEKRFAQDGQQALWEYKSFKPDLIILDLMLPVVSGYTFLKEIREREKDRKTAVIVCSSLGAKQDIVDCVKLGIQGYLLKPINFKEMSFKILDYLKAAQPERADEISKLREKIKVSPDPAPSS